MKEIVIDHNDLEAFSWISEDFNRFMKIAKNFKQFTE